MLNPSEMAVVYEDIVKCFRNTSLLTPKDTVEAVLKLHSFSDVAETFAALGRIKEHDGRIYGENRAWLNTFPVSPECYEWQNPEYRNNEFFKCDLDALHPTHINQIVTVLREKKKAENAREARALADFVRATSSGNRVYSVAEEKKKAENEGKSKLFPGADAGGLPTKIIEKETELDVPKYYDDVVRRASVKYIKEKQKTMTLRFKKEDYENRIAPAIGKSGLKTATFIKKAIDEKIERDKL